MARPLIAYFSPDGEAGLVAHVARKVQTLTDGQLADLALETPDVGGHSPVYLGYPGQHGPLPEAVLRFLRSNDFTACPIVPFAVHTGDGLADSVDVILQTGHGAQTREGLAFDAADISGQPRRFERQLIKWVARTEK